MKIQDLTKNDVVHCRTQEQAKTLLQAAHELGYKWGNGQSFLEYDGYSTYKGETCYNIKQGEYSPFKYYHPRRFNIVPFEQIELNPMEKTIKLTIEHAKELYKSNPDFRNTILSDFTNEELGIKPKIKTWEELEEIDGFFIDDTSEITDTYDILKPLSENENVCRTKEQAESILAFCKLTQLKAELGDACKIDWKTYGRVYTIKKVENELKVVDNNVVVDFLTFNDREVAEEFLEVNKELVETYLKGLE